MTRRQKFWVVVVEIDGSAETYLFDNRKDARHSTTWLERQIGGQSDIIIHPPHVACIETRRSFKEQWAFPHEEEQA